MTRPSLTYSEAERVGLADHAMSNLQTHFDVQPTESDGISDG